MRAMGEAAKRASLLAIEKGDGRGVEGICLIDALFHASLRDKSTKKTPGDDA